jgi:AcrR family transcriptional regulator
MTEAVPTESTRQDRRKAATRARIAEAADRLFAERGYAETSMDDISGAADVGVRTIYLHFGSKAAILLAYFDDWLDVFVAALVERPLSEPVEVALPVVTRDLGQNGWPDGPFRQFPGQNTFAALVSDGPPEVAGHLFISWSRAQRRLAVRMAEVNGLAAGSVEVEVRAATIIAAWTASVTLANEGFMNGTLDPAVTGATLGATVARLLAPNP